MQRFIGEDPIRFLSGDFNLYAYVKNSPIQYFDPFGFGQWGRRPLEGMPIMADPPVGGEVGSDFNLGLWHEQYWFDDGTNAGFFEDGVGDDLGHDRSEYEMFGDIYNDELMRDIIDDIDIGNYCLIGSNCQDWADRVREEYDRRNRPPCMILSGRKPHAC